MKQFKSNPEFTTVPVVGSGIKVKERLTESPLVAGIYTPTEQTRTNNSLTAIMIGNEAFLLLGQASDTTMGRACLICRSRVFNGALTALGFDTTEMSVALIDGNRYPWKKSYMAIAYRSVCDGEILLAFLRKGKTLMALFCIDPELLDIFDPRNNFKITIEKHKLETTIEKLH